MPRKKLELTKIQVKPGERTKWRKMYQGKWYYFRGSYQEALSQWYAKKAELLKVAVSPMQAQLEQFKSDLVARGMEEAARMLDQYVRENPQHLDHLKEWAERATTVSPDELVQHFIDDLRIGRHFNASEPNTANTIGQAVGAFLLRQKAKVVAGDISAGWYDIQNRCVNHFADFVGKRFSVDRINGQILVTYHTELLEQIGKGWTPDYADAYMRVCKQFVRWCWEIELLDNPPRNLKNPDLTITTTAKNIKPFSVEDITVILSHASERTRLFLLLMLNCGYTQKDLSDLPPNEVAWDRGRIIRKRSKTSDKEGVPTVEYPLWKETFRLLKKHGDQKGERVLTNEDGKPLKVEELRTDENGKTRLVKIDNVASAYARLVRKLKKKELVKEAKPLKLFRKTSHSVLKNCKDYSHYAVYFLGHSPRTVADRNYFGLDQANFDRAVKWLGRHYRIES